MRKEFGNVLIVDDCSLTLRRIAKTLRDEGYFVRTACNGAEALGMIEKSCPDYVITDWEMPIIDGQMLCQCLRAANCEKYIYLIIMTAHTDVMDVVDGLGAGADDYITKPLDARELLARMASGARILKLDRRLHLEAQTDPLTGVPNRRSLFLNMQSAVDVCLRKSAPMSCVILDIDRFKGINDVHGHQVGDHVLVQIADCLATRFRNADFVCRYGGEEFVIILPECDEVGAAVCAERCRLDIEKIAFSSEVEPFQVTASFGCSQLTLGNAATGMIDHADQALLAAKSSGRNKVVKFSELGELGFAAGGDLVDANANAVVHADG